MSHQSKTSDGVLLLTLVLAVAAVFGLSRWLDAHRPPVDPQLEEEKLYLNGATARRISLGFNGLAADWYWMRSLQYVGRKISLVPDGAPLDTFGDLNMKLLGPLLDTATTLDPQFMEPYGFTAAVLPDIDRELSIRIINKGIAANPGSWRLYQHLGFIYWQQKKYEAAGDAYDKGSRLPDAPGWMEAMKARMAIEGGSRALAREIYQRMYDQAEDDQVKEMARKRLLNLRSLDDREVLLKVLAGFQTRQNRCPTSWKEVEPALSTLGMNLDSNSAPIDPGGTPYVLIAGKCDLNLDRNSKVPRR